MSWRPCRAAWDCAGRAIRGTQQDRRADVKDRGDVLLSERVYAVVLAVTGVSIHHVSRGLCRPHGPVDVRRDRAVAHSAPGRDEVPATDPRGGRFAGTRPGPREKGVPDDGRHPDYLVGGRFDFVVGASNQPTRADLPGDVDLAGRHWVPGRLGESAVAQVRRDRSENEIPVPDRAGPGRGNAVAHGPDRK